MAAQTAYQSSYHFEVVLASKKIRRRCYLYVHFYGLVVSHFIHQQSRQMLQTRLCSESSPHAPFGARCWKTRLEGVKKRKRRQKSSFLPERGGCKHPKSGCKHPKSFFFFFFYDSTPLHTQMRERRERMREKVGPSETVKVLLEEGADKGAARRGR